jgi:predicted TIM-barrel fold metal-dependent hydrolase
MPFCEGYLLTDKFKFFDAHFHIIDNRFPLVPNDGYLPEAFTCQDYLNRTKGYTLTGGVIVSGSFQAYDQSYLLDALKTFGSSFVGVTQLPPTVSDEQLLQLDKAGVRALRFNLKRGGSDQLQCLDSMARRVYDLARWHVELYVDSGELADLYQTLVSLPAVSIDHIGLSAEGLSTLIKLAAHGTRVKATGFSRTDFDVTAAIRDLYSANPKSLMFGTDLPSTRAPRCYKDDDFNLIIETLGEEKATRVLYKNAIELYKP